MNYILLAGIMLLFVVQLGIAILFYDKLSNITNILLSGGPSPEPTKKIYRSADGKYEANSLEELIQKMANDPKAGLTDDELEALKKMFEQIEYDDLEDEE